LDDICHANFPKGTVHQRRRPTEHDCQLATCLPVFIIAQHSLPRTISLQNNETHTKHHIIYMIYNQYKVHFIFQNEI